MTAPRRRLPWMLFAMVLATATLALLLRPLRREQTFHVPDVAEAEGARAMFNRAFMLAARDGQFAAIGKEPARFGLVAARLEQPAGFSLAEPEGACTGRGAFMLREGSPEIDVLVTAPHRGADRDTGPLARQLFSEHGFAAAAWNSAPRRAGPDCRYSGDVAREPLHYITLFSLAFAHRFPGGRVVQLHGFDDGREDTSRQFDAIVSDGTRDPAPRLRAFAACLKRLFPERRIALFPGDSDTLGGTTNAQGKALRAAGFAGFTHLELSPGFRADLVADPHARALLAECLGAAG